MVDVEHKRCEHPGCTTGTCYGYPGHTATRCTQHKLSGMLKKPKNRCMAEGCREWSTHGVRQPERCNAHAWSGDANLVESECLSCGLVMMLDTAGKCEYCDGQTAKRAKLAKQREVVQFIDHCMHEHPYTSVDRVPFDLKDCGRKERPDVLWDLADRVVILEVDEEQHRGRPCECEQARMMNISQALGCERTLWIRYNPDAFTSDDARRWNKARRLELLRRWLVWGFTADLEHTISVVHLFFDGFREHDVRAECLLSSP